MNKFLKIYDSAGDLININPDYITNVYVPKPSQLGPSFGNDSDIMIFYSDDKVTFHYRLDKAQEKMYYENALEAIKGL